MKPLIIGVDPGSTSAVAGIDFNGETVFVESGKNFPPREIISETVDKGRPVVVASDKAKFPSNVDKIASSFGAYRFTVDEDLSAERKQELGEGDNSHEKDASAAARNAYRGLRNSIEKIKEIAEERESDTAEVASRYFKEELRPLSPEDEGMEETSSQLDEGGKDDETGSVEAKVSDRIQALRRENKVLETKADNLKAQVEDLEELIREEEKEKERWRSKYDRMRTEKRKEIMKERILSRKNALLKEKDEKISELKDKISKASIREEQYVKAFEKLENGGKLFRFYEDGGKDEDVFITRSGEVEELLKDKGEEVFHVDELEGVELLERIVLDERPERKAEEVLEEYRDGR